VNTTELRDCKHGQLARSCEICSLEDDVAKLTAENERLSALADKWNLECDDLREDNKRRAAERDAAIAKLAYAEADYNEACQVISNFEASTLEYEAKLATLAAQEPVAYIGYSPTKGNGQRLFWKLWAAQEYANDVTPLYTRAAP